MQKKYLFLPFQFPLAGLLDDQRIAFGQQGFDGASLPGRGGNNEKVTNTHKRHLQGAWNRGCRERQHGDFEKEHPDVRIQIEAAGDEPIKDKLRIQMGTDQQPDVFFSLKLF